MEFKLNSTDFEKLLSKVIPAIPVRTPLSILENFRFDIKDGQLTVTATDGEVTLRSSLNAAADDDISLIIPAKLLYDIVKSLEDTQIHFQVDKNNKLKLTTEVGEYDISFSSADEFPDMPKFSKEEEITISGEELLGAIEQTSFAMSKEDMRPAMTGTLFEFSSGKAGMKFVTTDGHRLVKFVNNKIKFKSQAQYIIPERAIFILPKLLGGSDVKIELSRSHASFNIGDVEFITRLIGEKYPNYEGVIPLENEFTLTIKTRELHSAIKRMMLFNTSTSRQVKLSVKKDNIEVSAEDIDHGSRGKEKVACSYKGEGMDIGFNTGYLNDVLSNVDYEEINFKLSSPTKACIIEPTEKRENEELLLLLMPVRLNE